MNTNTNYEYENMISQGRISELFDAVRDDYEVLASRQEFSRNGLILKRLWEEYPQLGKRLLLELIQGEDGTDVVKMLESISVEFEFSWNECKCFVNGNILFLAVWSGNHELVRELLNAGMDPNGVSYDVYQKKNGDPVASYSRWGKMKCREDKDDFFVFQHWREEPWGMFNQMGNGHIITPLFLAELTDDQEMIGILKEAGACPMPSREKMWEEAKAPEDSGSVFGNL